MWSPDIGSSTTKLTNKIFFLNLCSLLLQHQTPHFESCWRDNWWHIDVPRAFFFYFFMRCGGRGGDVNAGLNHTNFLTHRGCGEHWTRVSIGLYIGGQIYNVSSVFKNSLDQARESVSGGRTKIVLLSYF